MDIYFKTKKLQKDCNSKKKMTARWGSKRADKLAQRLMELNAATSLQDISRLPPARCHELGGDRKGQLSVDLVHPYRLLFVPANDPSPRRSDGGLDWSQVTEIEIVAVLDTH